MKVGFFDADEVLGRTRCDLPASRSEPVIRGAGCGNSARPDLRGACVGDRSGLPDPGIQMADFCAYALLRIGRPHAPFPELSNGFDRLDSILNKRAYSKDPRGMGIIRA